MEKNKKPIKLHLGCGNIIIREQDANWINIDEQEIYGVDKVINAYPLKLPSNYATVIYASHLLDHIEGNKLDILKEWKRVLIPSGVLRISVPDFKRVVEIYNKTGSVDLVKGCVLGRTDIRAHCHSILFDYDKLKVLMEEAGFEAIHTWSVRHQTHRNYFDMSQARTCDIPISLNLEGFKKVE